MGDAQLASLTLLLDNNISKNLNAKVMVLC